MSFLKCENVKLAREYALLGNYDSAMVYYQGLLDQMNKYLYVKDAFLQQKLQQVWHEISTEAKHVKDVMSTLESFKVDSSPVKAAQHDFPAQDGEVWSLPVQVERRPSPALGKRQSAQYSANRGHHNRVSVAGKGAIPSSSRKRNNQ